MAVGQMQSRVYTRRVATLRQLLTRPFRLPRLTPYAPDPNDPIIYWFNSEREDILRDVVQRTEARFVGTSLEHTLNEVCIDELKRLEQQKDAEARDELGFWKSMARRLAKMSDAEKRDALRAVAERMGHDIAGNFDPRVYKLAQKGVPRILTGIMQPSAVPQDLLRFGGSASPINDMLRTEGDIEHLRKLSKKGALVFVPTHSSNLDSVALGYALIRENLPPVVYGAGKNLFTNPIVSFFMHNLGAYRIDRRIRAALYKDVLKTYSTVLLERGYHSLFFPGGTRSRSGMVERRLKLGLAGTAIEAFARNAARGAAKPIYFVPTTINYTLVLEAETLIEDWLKESGRARYIIEDDEFSQLDRWVAFFRKLSQTRAACIIRFGRPMDPFGNPVDEEGHSTSPDGRTIDPIRYVQSGGEIKVDAARDAAYTRELGSIVKEHFERETVIMGTQLVSHILFRKLVREMPRVDLFGRMRARGEVEISREELRTQIGFAQSRLRDLESRGEVHLSERARGADPEELITRVSSAFDGYHRKQAFRIDGQRIIVEDPSLLLYYSNRLNAYAERIAHGQDVGPAREIARLMVD